MRNFDSIIPVTSAFELTHLKNFILNSLILLAWSIPFFSCTNKIYLDKITGYLNAPTPEIKAKFMADSYRSYFMKKDGEGDDKTTSLTAFNNWDGQLNPDVKILNYLSKDNIWFVRFNEQNDFSKLIGFPGWKGSMSVTFDSKGLIAETIYFPDSTNPSYKKWLQPALDWLGADSPNELNDVYQNNKLVKTEQAANQWKSLLKKWNDSKPKREN